MKQCNHLFVMYHFSYDGSEQTKLCRCVKCGLNNFRKNDGRKEKEMQTLLDLLILEIAHLFDIVSRNCKLLMQLWKTNT